MKNKNDNTIKRININGQQYIHASAVGSPAKYNALRVQMWRYKNKYKRPAPYDFVKVKGGWYVKEKDLKKQTISNK